MTAVSPVLEEASTQNVTESVGASAVTLALSCVVYPFAPKTIGKYWLRASVVKSAVLGFFNLMIIGAWAYAVMVFQGAGRSWTYNSLKEAAARNLPGIWLEEFHQYALLDKVAAVAASVVLVGVVVVLPFFVLLPFAARPGRNSPCVRHVARTVLLGLGVGNLWGAALVGVYVVAARLKTDHTIELLLFVVSGLLLWTLVALVRAVRLDYRGPKDMPQAHDPWCDACGYNLIAAEADGRCPECGRPVIESTGPQTRPPTAWEARPSIFNVPVIVRQVNMLVRFPRRLFFSMPTLTGQPAAQRWLILSMVAIALFSVPIFPIAMLLQEAEFSLMVVAGTAAMMIFWPIFALMMVGVETAGIATFSRMRGRPIYLAAAAKVTCYSSILMVLWVILGGTQMIVAVYWWYAYVLTHHPSVRSMQIFLAVTLGIAHIGGLLWYEFTVYRGIRAIQYANK